MKTLQQLRLLVMAILSPVAIAAQTPIVTVNVTNIVSAGTASYTAPGANNSSLSGNTYNYTFGAATQTSYNLKDLNNFVIGSDVFSYSYTANSIVKIRRADNPVVSGNRSLLWFESISTADPAGIAIVNPYKENMENIFDDNTFNAGTDNIFGNQGDGNGNNNNIERLDVIFPKGIIPTQNSKCGFAVFERGADNAHDPFVIAAITAVDNAGNPTQYGPLIRVNTPNWGNIPSSTTNYQIVRRDPAIETNLRVSTSGTQNIGGVYISMSDLSISNGTRVYGYSLFPLDVPMGAADADLVDYNDPTFFPRNTSGITTQGGLDMLAITGLFSTPNSFLIPPIAYDITMTPIVQASPILPFIATAFNSTIASYTVQTIPPVTQGVLYVTVNGAEIPITIGMVLTPEQINSMSFVPYPSFTGNVLFTYSATDSNNLLSNIANYTIPVIAQPSTILPVNLLNFTASFDSKKVELYWQTANGGNSSYYVIERSTDGNNFEPVSTITATNITQHSSYQSSDDLFFFLAEKVYYRLKIVDINGQYKYSTIIEIDLDRKAPSTTVKIWPNPFNDQLSAVYYSETEGPASINFSDMNGRTVLTAAVTLKKGQNSFVITQAQRLNPGMYIMQVAMAGKTQCIKVAKQ
ncbi:MAG: T9SS type A sorting domain-containing protein [Ferruginibacter sp.]